MKISIKDIAVHVEHTDTPFEYFVYVPNAPTFESTEDEERWVRRVKICLHQKMCEDPRLRAVGNGSHQIAYLPSGVVDSPDPLELPDDFYKEYNEGWCAVLTHPPQENETLSRMLDDIAVPGNYSLIIMPQGEQDAVSDVHVEEDFVDMAAKRFFILMFGLFVFLWIVSMMQR